MNLPLHTVAAALRDVLRRNVDRAAVQPDTTRKPHGGFEITVRHTFRQTVHFSEPAPGISADKHEMAAKNSAIRSAKEALISSFLGEGQ